MKKTSPKLRKQKQQQYDSYVLQSSMKKKIQRVFDATIKRLNKEVDPDKRYRLKVIKSEFSKLIDQL